MVISFLSKVTRTTSGALKTMFLLLASAPLMAADVKPSQSSPLLIPFEAKYTAFKWGGDVGTVSMKLEPLAKHQYSLTYSSDVSKFFLSDERFEHSIFFVKDGKLVPDTYYYKRTGTGPDKSLELTFDAGPPATVKVSNGKNLSWDGQTDNQLYRIDLSRKLAAGDTDDLEYEFVNYRGQNKSYGIKVLGNETLTLPYGKLDTIKVKLVRDNNTRETFAWFAPELDYNLVRLQQFKDGDEQGDVRLNTYTRL